MRSPNLNLTNGQEQADKELYSGRDVLAVLPTGFGKSRIYQAFSKLSLKAEEQEEYLKSTLQARSERSYSLLFEGQQIPATDSAPLARVKTKDSDWCLNDSVVC